MLGQKKVNKANDSYKLKKAKESNYKKSENNFGAQNTNRPNFQPS
ncbi:MAG: hypothetical protein H6Q72_168 [Firmicutes bacterium]|nr:hypothetical protein [Bacillota bacterium]